jgi:hypothetical protein
MALKTIVASLFGRSAADRRLFGNLTICGVGGGPANCLDLERLSGKGICYSGLERHLRDQNVASKEVVRRQELSDITLHFGRFFNIDLHR